MQIYACAVADYRTVELRSHRSTPDGVPHTRLVVPSWGMKLTEAASPARARQLAGALNDLLDGSAGTSRAVERPYRRRPYFVTAGRLIFLQAGRKWDCMLVAEVADPEHAASLAARLNGAVAEGVIGKAAGTLARAS